jgi:hypothetical protein
MGELLYFKEHRNKDQFRIDYPYYGLFGSADITAVTNEQGLAYQCILLNGSVVNLKKIEASNKWIDTSLDIETPLSSIMGLAIEEFLNKSEGKKINK